MLVPYNDPFYYSRRADDRACRPATCCRSAPTRPSVALGLHPRLTGLKQIFDHGRLALIQRTGYPNQSRSHFQGTDIWSTANPANSSRASAGWAAISIRCRRRSIRWSGWNTTRDLPRVLQSSHVSVPAIPNPATYAFSSPNARRRSGGRARRRRCASTRTCRSTSPTLAFVYGSAQAAMATLDRVATVATYTGTVTYPPTTAWRRRCKPSPARWSAASARACSTSRPAASTRTRRRTRTSNGVVLQPDGARSTTACSRSTTT